MEEKGGRKRSFIIHATSITFSFLLCIVSSAVAGYHEPPLWMVGSPKEGFVCLFLNDALAGHAAFLIGMF